MGRRSGARLLVMAAGLWVALACGAQAGPREEALQVVETWRAAFNAPDVDAIVKLYAPDATFLGTTSPAVVTDPAGVRRYFENALKGGRREAPIGPPSVSVLSNKIVLITGFDTVSGLTADGRTVTMRGRVTFVVARRGREWLIVHFHRSSAPG